MTQAISQLHSPEGSALGSYLAELIGFQKSLPKALRKQSPEENLLKKYQAALIKEAQGSYEWQEFAEYLRVGRTKKNKIIVYIDGPDSVIERANLLEYGTPERVANPLMRVTEATFNSDYESKRMFKL